MITTAATQQMPLLPRGDQSISAHGAPYPNLVGPRIPIGCKLPEAYFQEANSMQQEYQQLFSMQQKDFPEVV